MRQTGSIQKTEAAVNSSRPVYRTLVHRLLRGISRGRLTIKDPWGEVEFGPGGEGQPQATIEVRDPSMYGDVAMRGSIGAGEAYMRGAWTSPDLTSVIRVFVANRELLTQMDSAFTKLAMPFWKLAHWLRRNNHGGSKKNILAHYDLGNEFFRLFLDETLMYSSAVFDRPDMTLAEASRAKLDRICDKLQLKPSDHVIEIGTGWGGFAIHAASKYGCRVTTTTISEAQFALATKRVNEAGLQDRVRILRDDYRELPRYGLFDKLVSIEMIEAVGARYLEQYIQVCSRLLKPEGAAVIQAITIADQEYERALKSVDFIQKYIFPGSFIPSVTAIVNAMTNASDFRLVGLEDITSSYVETLRRWRASLMANAAEVRKLGLSDSFLRMWEFYFCYCEGGFTERAIGDVQLHLKKPLCK
jgi:cyclopropane-fatty-acyl-phospholipid synthase